MTVSTYAAALSRRPLPLLCALTTLLAACGGGGDDDGPTVTGPTITIVKASPSGDGQTAGVGTQLPEPLRVIVQRDGSPLANTTVLWTTDGGGSLAPSSASTDAAGLATSIWTLGPGAGAQTARATVQGTPTASVTFTATATTEPPPVGTVVVQVQNNSFVPDAITVRVGSTVRWNWAEGALQHNVTPATAGGPSQPNTMDGPFSFEFTFTQPGTYNYFCSVHGSPTGGMRGTVTVVP